MRITIILIAPVKVESTGTATRVTGTMGFSELWTINSQARLEPVAHQVAYGLGDIIDNIRVFKTLAESLHDIDFTVVATTRSRAEYHYYATPVELVPLLEEKSSWMSHAVLVFSRGDSGLTNEELALVDVPTGVPVVVDYPSLDLEQAVMVCYYQLATLIQQPTKSDTVTGQRQLQTLRERVMILLTTLAVADDIKLVDWLQQRLGLLEQRDTTVLHHLLHGIEKSITK